MASSEPADPESVARSICESVEAEFEAERGAGAYKNVYQVTLPTGQRAALKLIRSPSASPRIQREIEAGQRANHPSIANLLEVGIHEFEDSEYAYYFEELLEGGSLEDRIESEGTLSLEETLNLGHSLLEALEHLSGLGLVHRDIKPANIMFREDSARPVLVDFGLVRDLEATSLTPSYLGRGPGTPYYAAPEQLNNEKEMIDWRSDQFSVGVVLSICCLGVHPYQAEGENLFEEATVRRVSARGNRLASFDARCRDVGVPDLVRMTEQWPVSRYRNPADAITSWQSQGDS